VSKCENTKVFNGWLQCDCRPFKQALLNTIKRWSFMFKRYLSDHVINRWAGPTPLHPSRDPCRAQERHMGSEKGTVAMSGVTSGEALRGTPPRVGSRGKCHWL
jgi:dynein heavy chain